MLLKLATFERANMNLAPVLEATVDILTKNPVLMLPFRDKLVGIQRVEFFLFMKLKNGCVD